MDYQVTWSVHEAYFIYLHDVLAFATLLERSQQTFRVYCGNRQVNSTEWFVKTFEYWEQP